MSDLEERLSNSSVIFSPGEDISCIVVQCQYTDKKEVMQSFKPNKNV